MGLVEVVIWGTAVAFFGGAWVTGRFLPAGVWLVFPVGWVIAVAVVAVRGDLTTVRDVVLACIGLIITIVAVGAGADRRRRRERQ
ncbi:hypothetical protein [Curtobacterium sp. RRHDQ10]|uniref:hypothetical protein n=1 Tax=Curtobacterium phyllosphaerae TaxID=3413379 RepID=UPI003BF06758